VWLNAVKGISGCNKHCFLLNISSFEVERANSLQEKYFPDGKKLKMFPKTSLEISFS
jgi:hypothetical protein